jgi:hypothetical protein
MMLSHRSPVRFAALVVALTIALAQGLGEFLTLQRWRLRAWMAR